MVRGKKTRWYDWLGCAVVALVGMGFLWADQYSREHGTTPEHELKVATGIPELVKESAVGSTRYLRFSVAGYVVDYSSDMRGFAKVVQALRYGVPVTVGVSSQRETLIPHPDWQALYTLAIGGDVILSYQDTVTKGYRASNAPLVVGLVTLGLGLFGLYTCVRNRDAVALSPAELMEKWHDPERKKLPAFLVTAGIYGALMSATYDPDSLQIFRMVFGDNPLGLPLKLFIGLMFSVLYVPVIIAAWQFYRIAYLKYHGEWSGIHQDVKRARFIIKATIVFYALLFIAWIWYAEANDIRLPQE